MGNFFEDIGKSFGDLGQGFVSWSGWDDAGDWASGKYVYTRLKGEKILIFNNHSIFLIGY